MTSMKNVQSFFTVAFLSEMWERLVSQYNTCVVEGVHYILGKYDEGITFEEIKRYAHAPDGKRGTAWKFTPIFDFDDDQGFWKSVILPEIRHERQRQDILNLVAARVKPTNERYRKGEERAGGLDEKPKGPYPAGPNLTALERKMGLAHRPLDKHGKILCYNFSAHSGCAKGEACAFSHTQRTKPEGLRWAVKFDLARRGGHLSDKRIDAPMVEGYVLALRNQNAASWKKTIEESKGAVGRKDVSLSWMVHCQPRLEKNGVVEKEGGNKSRTEGEGGKKGESYCETESLHVPVSSGYGDDATFWLPKRRGKQGQRGMLVGGSKICGKRHRK